MQAEHQCFTGASGRRGWEPTVLQRDPFLTKRKMVSEGVTKSLANSGTNNFGTYYCVCFTYDGIFFSRYPSAWHRLSYQSSCQEIKRCQRSLDGVWLLTANRQCSCGKFSRLEVKLSTTGGSSNNNHDNNNNND